MSIRRGGSWTGEITLPDTPDQYSAIVVTMSQNQNIVHSFTSSSEEILVEENRIVVQLTQAETAMFAPSEGSPMGRRNGSRVYLQVRCYKSPYDAPASKTWDIPVYDSNETGVLP